MFLRLALCMSMLVLILAGCGGAPSGALQGQKLPDVEFISLDGERVRISDFAGRPLVINFWATWCGPCQEEIPVLQAAYDRYYASDGLQILGVTDEQAAVVEPFVRANRMSFPVLYDRSGRAGSRYRVQSIPTTLFVNGEGIVVTRYTGTLKEGRLQLYIERLLSNADGQNNQPAPTDPPAQPGTVPQPTTPPPPPVLPTAPPPRRDDVGRHDQLVVPPAHSMEFMPAAVYAPRPLAIFMVIPGGSGNAA